MADRQYEINLESRHRYVEKVKNKGRGYRFDTKSLGGCPIMKKKTSLIVVIVNCQLSMIIYLAAYAYFRA